jgi:hypothetical protein
MGIQYMGGSGSGRPDPESENRVHSSRAFGKCDGRPSGPEIEMKLILKIAKLKPATLPGAELAAVLAEYAVLLGEQQGVHFTAIRDESVGIETQIGVRHRHAVRERLRRAAEGLDPEVARPKLGLNRFLAKYATTAELLELRQNGEVRLCLKLEGKAAVPAKSISVRDRVCVQGRLHRIEGRDETVHIGFDDDGRVFRAKVTRAQAMTIAQHMFGLVQVEGTAELQRNALGVWEIGEIRAEDVRPLHDEPLSVTVEKLRSLGGLGWRREPRGLDALADLQGDE